jgi:MoaA/NifB/PqqE/SkfB family radical SAM enzyme
MRLSNKIVAVYAALKAKIFGKRTPLLVSWEITRRCNARCKYCNTWNNASKELDTGAVISIIHQLGELGTRMINFTGGEPLLREDIGMILDCCHKNNISTSMNSNGSFVPQRINELNDLQALGISIDGPEEVHDRIRGEGSFRMATEALAVARDRGIRLRLLTVLSEFNLESVGFILKKSVEFDAPAIFQPATKLLLGANEANPIAPDVRRYREAIKELIARKKGRESRYIVNSISGLKFLYNWPDMKRIQCLLNLITCRIESDGNVRICYRNHDQAVKIDEKQRCVKDAFSRLPFIYCDRCCCAATVEMNCLLSLKLDAIFNTWSYIY